MKNQHIFSCFLAEGVKKKFLVRKPDYNNNNENGHVHTEEIAIAQINHYLEAEKPKGGNIVMYSLNSPCMKRERNAHDPCIVQLFKAANQWHIEYNITTIFLYTKPWGPIASKGFQEIQTIPDRIAREFRFSIQLRKKLFWKKSFSKYKIEEFFPKVEKDRKKFLDAHKQLKKDLTDVATSQEVQLTTEEYLNKGKEKITLSLLPEELTRKISKIWKEFIEIQKLKGMNTKITEILNGLIVKWFLNNQEASPIQFYKIPPID